MKVSQLYGKRTVSTAGATGYVISVNTDGKRIVGLICADENERRFAIDINSVKSVKSVVIYKNEPAKQTGKPLRLGKPVFDCEGTFLGKLTDFTADKYELQYAHVGNKKYSADHMVNGDAVILTSGARILKSDVKKNGKTIIKKGTPLTPETLQKAQLKGEYIQANLKTI